MPDASATPVLSSVMTLVASVTLLVGVKVAVHVIPPSEEDTDDRVPFAMVKSALVNPLTASEKVIVTVAVSPIFSAVSESVIVAVGRAVSIVTLNALEAPLTLPAASIAFAVML